MSIEVYPVVHVRNPDQAAEQTEAAFSTDADGVYLIRHSDEPSTEKILLESYATVRELYPERFIGINILGSPSAADSLVTVHNKIYSEGIVLPSGLWCDDAIPDAELFPKVIDTYPHLNNIRYLGGVAFKYTPTYTDDPRLAAKLAERLAPFVDVVTTSGPGTGHSASLEKIKAMKQAIGEKKLAVASGISVANIGDFDGYVAQTLVASSVETQPYSGVFDIKLLRELVDSAHQS